MIIKTAFLTAFILMLDLCMLFQNVSGCRTLSASDSNRGEEEMILIPAGEFIYGLSREQISRMKKKYDSGFIYDHFERQRTITLSAFRIDKYEVTNKQFLAFLNSSQHKTPEKFNKSNAAKNPLVPVNNIGWPDARAYAKWAGKRLPTEEEWEKAARGTEGRLWPWGDKDESDYYNGVKQEKFTPVNVGSFEKGNSPYKVSDMAGNVYEMTTGKWFNGTMCMRGGSYLNKGAYTMCSFRWAPGDTINGAPWLGFRCVKDVN
ncbi:MAG TPA: SUMF1/EgtB/PvdO family nonheme iron enzyme [Bacteroidia bacterium]|nr:SUMF1/EgtB/PvdO family nonheme iron enzyme [Bacteroidia bacterium]